MTTAKKRAPRPKAESKSGKSAASKSGRSRAAARKGQDARSQTLIWSGVALGAVAAAVGIGAVFFSRTSARKASGGEHPVPDLAADAPVPGTNRAPVDFRPDPTAVPDKSEYESLRPATGPAPTLSATRGEMANQTGVDG